MAARPAPGSATRMLLPALAAQPGHLLWRAHARLVATMGEVLPAGVDVHAYAVLLALADGKSRSQRALADQVGVSGTTLVKVAADLDRLGLVERVRNPEDRRSYALTRTPAGALATREWGQHVEGLTSAFTSPLDETEAAALVSLLRRAAEPDLAPDTPAELLDSLGFLVSRLKFRMHRVFQGHLAPLGIEPQHYGALSALVALGAVSQAEVARALGMSPAHMVQVTDELAARGLVERVRDERDRRTQLLHVTEAGTEVHRRAAALADASADEVLGLPAADVRRVVALLVALVSGESPAP